MATYKIATFAQINEEMKDFDWSILRALTDEQIQAGIDADPIAKQHDNGYTVKDYYEHATRKKAHAFAAE